MKIFHPIIETTEHIILKGAYMAKINFKEMEQKAKIDNLVKGWEKLNNGLVEMGPYLTDVEVEFVKQMIEQRMNFMISHAGYRKAVNPLTGKEELVRP